MAGLIDDIAGYLLGAGLVDYEVEVGDTPHPRDGYGLCRQFVPHKPDQIVVVSEYAGNPPTLRTGRDEPGLQIRVRSEPWQYADAKAKCDAIRLALHGLGGSIGAGYYVEIAATQSAWSLGNDSSERPEVICNFIARRSR